MKLIDEKSYKRIAFAVLRQAIIDLHEGTEVETARLWLRSNEGPFSFRQVCLLFDLRPFAIRQAIVSGCVDIDALDAGRRSCRST